MQTCNLYRPAVFAEKRAKTSLGRSDWSCELWPPTGAAARRCRVQEADVKKEGICRVVPAARQSAAGARRRQSHRNFATTTDEQASSDCRPVGLFIRWRDYFDSLATAPAVIM